jgi:hypothetical protein
VGRRRGGSTDRMPSAESGPDARDPRGGSRGASRRAATIRRDYANGCLAVSFLERTSSIEGWCFIALEIDSLVAR